MKDQTRWGAAESALHRRGTHPDAVPADAGLRVPSEEAIARQWTVRVRAQAVAPADPVAAARMLEDDPLGSITPTLPADQHFLAFAARLAAAAGEASLAARAREAARRLVVGDASPQPLSTGISAYVLGTLDRDVDQLQIAARLLLGPRPLLAARASECAGDVLAAQQQPSSAIAEWSVALDTFAACGAEADVRRLSDLLGAHGPRRCAKNRRPRTGWASLTDSERKVVCLIAAGATNREAARDLFLSPHTVNTHMRNVFAKLGIRSRVQLANLAHEFAD